VTTAPLSGLDPIRVVLPGGATVIVKETRKTPAVSIHLAIRAGSDGDPVDRTGAAHLLGRVIDRGTASRSADAVAQDLEGRGVSLSVGANRHFLSMACTCLTEDFDAVLALLAEIVMAPALPDAEITTGKGEVVSAIRQDEDSPAAQAIHALMATLYGPDHPYGRPLKGTLESVGEIGRDDLARMHAVRFGPQALCAVVVGDVDAFAAVRVASDVFGAWTVPPPEVVEVPGAEARKDRQRVVVPMPALAQTEVAMGFVTIRRRDPDYYAYWLMNNILGQYAMGGRLGSNIRERQGMAYSVSSVLDASLAEGPLVIRAGVSAANVDRTIASIDEELTRMRGDGVTVRELTESRQYLIGSMPRALETNAGIAAFLQTAEFFGLGLDYDVRLPDLLEAVTREGVRDAARRFLDPDRATIAIAGPYEG
jgi:zinc protease